MSKQQSTSIRTATSTPDLDALVSRLQALDRECAEHLRTLRFGLDDLGSTLESQRQVRHEIVALLTTAVQR